MIDLLFIALISTLCFFILGKCIELSDAVSESRYVRSLAALCGTLLLVTIFMSCAHFGIRGLAIGISSCIAFTVGVLDARACIRDIKTSS